MRPGEHFPKAPRRPGRDFRRHVNEKFLNRRRTAVTEAFTYSFEQAQQLMQQREVFDVSKEPAKDVERYGKYDFGRHCLLARRLLEKGITFVQLTHSNYDTHNENFNFHIEQLGEFDRSFACFVNDLAERGMLDSTLIVVLSEFGRTPNINLYHGRDHWSKAWSVCLAGCRIPRGHAYGKTNADGTAVEDGAGRSRRAVSHVPGSSRRRFHGLIRHRWPQDADGRSGRGFRFGTSYLVRASAPMAAPAGLDPKLAYVASQWPYDRPLQRLPVRSRRERSSSAAAKTRTSSGSIWPMGPNNSFDRRP